MIGKAFFIISLVGLVSSCGNQNEKTSPTEAPVNQEGLTHGTVSEIAMTTACDLAAKVVFSEASVDIAEISCNEMTPGSGVFEITGLDGQKYRVGSNKISAPGTFMPSKETVSPFSIYNSEQDYWSNFGALFNVIVPEQNIYCISLNNVSVDGKSNSVFVEREGDEAPYGFSVQIEETGQIVKSPLSSRKYAFSPGSSYFAIFSRERNTGIHSVEFQSCS